MSNRCGSALTRTVFLFQILQVNGSVVGDSCGVFSRSSLPLRPQVAGWRRMLLRAWRASSARLQCVSDVVVMPLLAHSAGGVYQQKIHFYVHIQDHSIGQRWRMRMCPLPSCNVC
jgi:hypothetical protein